MSVVAIYNMKGGVGKTTTAVNLAYLAAANGRRVLLWDLDPQAASSFAFRVRPRVARFSRKSLVSGQALAEAIKETDYSRLDLLPADFAYRKIDRHLARLGKPQGVVTSLLQVIGRDYDLVLLDCPAGFSLLTEGIFAAADAVLVPTIPTVLSLRTVARLIKWADRTESPSQLMAFLSMVDRRKALHQRISEWSGNHPEIFLAGQIPYASVVEQMTVRRLPLPLFAPREAAAVAFTEIWGELETRLDQGRQRSSQPRASQPVLVEAIESLIARLESPERDTVGRAPLGNPVRDFLHTFDTDGLDLQRIGYVIELRERVGSLQLVVRRADGDGDAGEAQIDRSWATQILAGSMSPLAALESRLGQPRPAALECVRAALGGRRLRRVDSRVAEPVRPGVGVLPLIPSRAVIDDRRLRWYAALPSS